MTMNESIYYNVDIIHSAIDKNVMIEFQYYQWNVDKEMELRHDGHFIRFHRGGLSGIMKIITWLVMIVSPVF